MEDNKIVLENGETVIEKEKNVPESGEDREENGREDTPDTAKPEAGEQMKKLYSQEEVDAIVGKRLARKEARIRKEYEDTEELTELLRAGTGKKTLSEITESLRSFYSSKGVDVPKKAKVSDADTRTLAAADARAIIEAGEEEVNLESRRLSEADPKSLSARERETLAILDKHRRNAEKTQELERMGIGKDVYNSAEYQEFASQFNEEVPAAKVYELWKKTQPKKEIRTMGSMKSNVQDNGVKEYYTPEEARRFTQAEINNNPALVEAIERSMRKW